MTACVLNGQDVARDVLADVARRADLLHQRDIIPRLAFVLIGSSGPALVYAKRLERLAQPVGITVTRHHVDEEVSQAELEEVVACLNRDTGVDGILVQMPLPEHLTPSSLSVLIDPHKDVDGITVNNAGRLYIGLPTQAPSTALAMVQILDWAGIEVTGKDAVVIGRSNVVGHPVAELLLQRDATVTVTHRSTRDLAHHTRQAEILMVAAGDPHLVKAGMISRGVTIVDAGINVTAHGLVGDVDFEPCLEVAGAITPVPGGVGPVTNAVLLRSVIISAEEQRA